MVLELYTSMLHFELGSLLIVFASSCMVITLKNAEAGSSERHVGYCNLLGALSSEGCVPIPDMVISLTWSPGDDWRTYIPIVPLARGRRATRRADSHWRNGLCHLWVADSYMSIPSSVDTICENAFFGCRNLVDVEVRQGMHTIGGMRLHLPHASRWRIPASTVRIGPRAFSGCESLLGIEFENTEQLLDLGHQCFSRRRDYT